MLAAFPDVEVVTGAFEDWDPGAETFDGVVSFNAFHWIDHDVRFAKTAAVLEPGRSLAVFGGGARFVAHDGADPCWLALDEEYVAVTGEPEPRLTFDTVRDRSEEFTEGGYFSSAARRLYRSEVGVRRRRVRRPARDDVVVLDARRRRAAGALRPDPGADRRGAREDDRADEALRPLRRRARVDGGHTAPAGG